MAPRNELEPVRPQPCFCVPLAKPHFTLEIGVPNGRWARLYGSRDLVLGKPNGFRECTRAHLSALSWLSFLCCLGASEPGSIFLWRMGISETSFCIGDRNSQWPLGMSWSP